MKNNIPDLQAADRKAWSSIYDPQALEPVWHALPFLDDLANEFRKAECYRILDAACGDGGQMLALPEDLFLVGLDQSPIAVANAQNNLTEQGRRNFLMCEGRIEQQPFPDASFDGILFVDALSCFLDPMELLMEFRRVLKPGGLLISTTFSRSDPIASSLNFLEDHLGLYDGKFINVLHNEQTLRSLHSKSNFEITKIYERRDPEAPHPGFREQWHEHSRLVAISKAI